MLGTLVPHTANNARLGGHPERSSESPEYLAQLCPVPRPLETGPVPLSCEPLAPVGASSHGLGRVPVLPTPSSNWWLEFSHGGRTTKMGRDHRNDFFPE